MLPPSPRYSASPAGSRTTRISFITADTRMWIVVANLPPPAAGQAEAAAAAYGHGAAHRLPPASKAEYTSAG
jgi:hypothetical protein